MALRAALGDSDFVSIRRQGAAYVDKTHAVAALATSATKVTLFTRPRRFGKSTLLSTLEAFFQRPEVAGDTAPLFADLAVWRDDEARQHHQRYPVLTLSLKDLGQGTWHDMMEMTRIQLGVVARRFAGWVDHPRVPADLRHELRDALSAPAQPMRMATVPQLLCEALHAATGQPVVLLIDEYDSPLHAAWQHGYLDEALGFFRALFSSALKENHYLHKAVITGILRIARESLFSTINHLEVWSLLQDGFADAFGFTQAEVEALAASAGLHDRLPDLEAWYNGYLVGGVRLYNPWSILCCLRDPTGQPQPYWVNTGGTALAERLLSHHGTAVGPSIQRLLAGEAITGNLPESLVFSDLTDRVDAVWSLLLAAGYLKPRRLELAKARYRAELVIPNEEVHVAWEDMAARALRDTTRGTGEVDRLTEALLSGDEPAFAERLRRMTANALSYHDLAGDWPERVWQAFALGLLVHLDPGWEVRSNLETGYGRADVVVRPRQPGRPGVILEFKRIDEGQDVDAALDAALHQLHDRDYAASLRGVASPLREVAVVFEGKRPHVRFRR